MTLRQLQSIFALKVCDLIKQGFKLGYEITLGEAWRSPEEAQRLAKLGKGIKNSLHCKRLAIDLNLFSKNGTYLTSSEHYKKLGEWWEKQSTDKYKCAWGGRFGDGNHFSIEYGGNK